MIARIAFVLSVLSVLYSSAHGATPEEGARTEGEVVFYSSLNNEQIVTLVDAFKKQNFNVVPNQSLDDAKVWLAREIASWKLITSTVKIETAE